MLLRFAVTNHTSIRERQELSAIALDDRPDVAVREVPGLQDKVLPVIGIFGANASGKSNVMDAIRFMVSAVIESHQRWQPGRPIPRTPFALDDVCRRRPSEFVMDFVAGGVRYEYGFSCDGDRFIDEWLYSYPESRPRLAFRRSAGDQVRFGPSFGGPRKLIASLMRPNSLYLSAAAANNHRDLGKVYNWFRSGLAVATDANTTARIARTALLYETHDRQSIIDLLRYADLGIDGMIVRQEELPDEARRHLVQAFRVMNPNLPDFEDEDLTTMSRVDLTHLVGDRSILLPMEAESSGTITWLGMAGPVLDALRAGQALVVDELSARLHPQLAGHLIKLFQDPDTNRRGAQLIFNSHDPTALGSYAPARLHRDQVWFTEKLEAGTTRLFPLTEYRIRDGVDNVERQYLLGKFGAVPFVDETHLASVVEG